MKSQLSTRVRSRAAFTGWDLLICLVTVFLLLGVLLPMLAKSRARPKRINCAANLKQIGLAFRMWSNDSGNKFPMQSSMLGPNRGTMEFNLTGEVWRHFKALSNELNTPKVLVCTSDGERSRATSFEQLNRNGQLSYFVGLDADESNPQTILSGDRNVISSTVKPAKGVLNISGKDPVEWTGVIHNRAGYIGLGDGSASHSTIQTLNKQFQAALVSTTQAVHRIALPE